MSPASPDAAGAPTNPHRRPPLRRGPRHPPPPRRRRPLRRQRQRPPRRQRPLRRLAPTTYLKVTDRSVSFTLPGIGARITNSYDGGGQGELYLADLSEDGSSLIVAHAAATDTYRGTYGADTIEGVPTRTVVNDSPYIVYRASNGSMPIRSSRSTTIVKMWESLSAKKQKNANS